MLESRHIRPVCASSEATGELSSPPLIGKSDAFQYVQFRIEQVAPTDVTILLLGETGTGKGMVAHAIHQRSRRRASRFVNVNCAALPPTLVESELFGHERGAFTDARATQVGRFELAHGGTIFLDEVGELPLSVQAKLLHVLQEGRFERLGSPRTITVDVRVIAATNRNIADDIRRGRFRSDLYYRLNVVPITLPPLRDRLGDVPLLTRHLVERLSRKYDRSIEIIPTAILEQLEAYDWPGNVRELENVLERAVIASGQGSLGLAEPLGQTGTAAVSARSSLVLEEVERAHVLRVLGLRGWQIEGRRGAAAALGLRPSTLRSRMRKLGISRVDREPALRRPSPIRAAFGNALPYREPPGPVDDESPA